MDAGVGGLPLHCTGTEECAAWNSLMLQPQLLAMEAQVDAALLDIGHVDRIHNHYGRTGKGMVKEEEIQLPLIWQFVNPKTS